MTGDQASCLARAAGQMGGVPATVQFRRHPDLIGLHGAPGAAVAQAYEQCVGVTFTDAFGYEP